MIPGLQDTLCMLCSCRKAQVLAMTPIQLYWVQMR